MKPEEAGNCVKLGDTYIPAVNIQVEGVPGFIYHPDGSHAWYGVYFEILFENMSLWVVTQGSEYMDDQEWDESIQVLEYPRWGQSQSKREPGVTLKLDTWEDFVDLYHEKKIMRKC